MRTLISAKQMGWGTAAVWCLCCSAFIFSQGIHIDPVLIKDIVSGHQVLERSIQNLSGKIERFKDGRGNPQRQFFFYRSEESLRLDFINPMEGTDVLPGDKRNDVTEIIMRSNGNDYRYSAVPTTGIPFANLLKSKSPNSEIQVSLQLDLYAPINSLFSMPAGAAFKIIDVLQHPIGKIENKGYEDVPNALWISGVETPSNFGDSNWTFVLNPNQHYALLYHSTYVKKGNTKGHDISTSYKVTSQTTPNGLVVPKEIVMESSVNGASQNSTRYVITIGSAEKPDAKLFTEESFKELGRDIAIVDVLPNQKQMPGRIVEAAPLETRLPDYSAFPMEQGTNWSWTRILLLAIGVIMVIIACVMKLYNRRK